MLKKGDVFRRAGDPELFVVIRDFPDGSLLLLYRDQEFEKPMYAGTKIKDCKDVKIKGNLSKYLPEEINTAELDVRKIMLKAETYDKNK